MALTINHQTNDISATSGSVTIDGAAAGGGAYNLINTTTISSSVSSVDFTSIGSYTRWRIIGSFELSANAYHAIKLYDNGTLISGNQYSSYRGSDYGSPSVYNGPYGFLTNLSIKNGFFIHDIEMVDGRPYVKMDVSGQSADSHTVQRQDNTVGCLVNTYSLTSLTGFNVNVLGTFSSSTYTAGKISLYGVSS